MVKFYIVIQAARKEGLCSSMVFVAAANGAAAVREAVRAYPEFIRLETSRGFAKPQAIPLVQGESWDILDTARPLRF